MPDLPPSFDLLRLRNPNKFKKRIKLGPARFESIKITTFQRYYDNQYPFFSVHGTSLPNITFIVSQDNNQDRGDRIILDFNNPFQNASTYYGLTDQQLYRLQQKDNPWITNNLPVSTIIEQSNQDQPFIHKGAGEDVDLVIIDTEVWHGNTEFNSNAIRAKNPRDYRSGNALRDIPESNGSSATCGVLDLYLDGPAYLDPDFFYNPANSERTLVRWDGTIMPRCSAASDWWNTNSLSARSSKFVSPGNGGTATGDDDFGVLYLNAYDNLKFSDDGLNVGLSAGELARGQFCGTPSRIPTGSHGTSCASLAYGRTQGWAYNSNKWSLAYGLGDGASVESMFDVITVFHKVKSVNNTKNNKNPTVLSMSWGMAATLNNISGNNSNNVGKYLTFRGDTTLIEASTAVVDTPTNVTERSFKIKDNNYLDGMQYSWHEMVDNSITEAGNELIEAGVICFVAAGNGNSNIVNSSHPNFNNFIHDDENTSFPGPEYNTPRGPSTYPEAVYRTTSRRGYPLAAGKTEDGEYPVIAVGALDCSLYQGKEIKSWYSSNGNGIDLFCPSDGIKASTTSTYNGTDVLPDKGSPDGTFQGSLEEVNRLDNTYADLYPPSSLNTNLSATNSKFGGTSGATPICAGFLTTLLAHNREWTWKDLKNWISNHVEGQPPETFYQDGGDPDTIVDTAWNFLPPDENFIKIRYDKSSLGIRGRDMIGTISPMYPANVLPKIPYLTQKWYPDKT